MADYKVDIDVSVNDSKLDELEKRINSIKDKTIPIKLEVDSSSLKGIESQLKNASKTQTLKMNADTSGVKKEISSALKSVNSISMKPIKPRVDSGEAEKRIVNLKKLGDNVTTKPLEFTADTSSAQKNLESLNAVIDRSEIDVKELQSVLKEFKFDGSSIKTMTSDLEKANAAITDVKARFQDDKTLQLNIKGVERVGELTRELQTAVTIKKKFDKETGEDLGWGTPSVTHTIQLYKKSGEAAKQAAAEKKQAAAEAKAAEREEAAAAKQAAKEEAAARKQAAAEAKAAAQAAAAEQAAVDKIRQRANKGGTNRGLTDDFTGVEEKMRGLGNAANNLENTYQELIAARRELETALAGTDSKRIISADEQYTRSLDKMKSEIKSVTAAKKEQDAVDKSITANMRLRQKADNLSLSMDSWMSKNTAAAKNFGGQIENLKAQLMSCDAVQFNNIQNQFKKIQTQAELAGKTGLSFGDKIKAQFSKLGTYFGVSSVMLAGMQGIREAFQNVLDVDTQLTELYRVTDLTSQQYSDVYDKLTVSAKEYGSTLTDLISATADWSRAGFDADTAAGLAEVTAVYQHISDLDYDEASENLLTAYKGFESELKENFDGDAVSAVSYVSDILNELDNNYSVTAAGVGEAMKRSASAMEVAGNTIQETAGMITGITEVTQDPEKAGNALKVVSMRLRGKTTFCLRTRKVCTLCFALNCKNIEDSYIRQSARVA